MLKKFLVAMTVLVLTVSLCVGFVIPTAAAENKYSVGYARVDINPYVDPSLTGSELTASENIMQLPLRGSGDVWNRLSTKGLVDDNGDGVIDENDGLKVTCIAVTDANGKTVLLMTIDLIGGTLISKVRTEVLARVEEALASGEISNVDLDEDGIYYAGTHTHNAPDTTVYTEKGKTGTNNDGVDLSVVNENLGIWIDRTIENIGNAAILALKDRAQATMSKDQLSAADATSPSVAGKVLNMTRHYYNVENGSVAGDNFNSRGDTPEAITEVDDNVYLVNFTFEDTNKLPIVMAGWRGHPSLNNSDTYENSGKNCVSSDFVNTFRHALEYGCDVETESESGTGSVTSWELGTKQKYRVAYFQGTGGNVNPRGHEVLRDENGAYRYLYNDSNEGYMYAYSWIDLSAKGAQIKGRACSYGVVLADFVDECINDGKNKTKCDAGEIKTISKKFHTYRKLDGINQLSYNASVSYQEAAKLYSAALSSYNTANSKYKAYQSAYDDYNGAGFLGFLYKTKMETALKEYNTALSAHQTKLDDYVTFVEANTRNTAYTASTSETNGTKGPDKPLQQHPYIYVENGESFAIGSRFHASSIIGDWNAKLNIPITTESDVTLGAISMGDDLTFVVIPGEPYDYYYTENGVYTPENNLWNILDDGNSYGKPFVLGYCNGAVGYFPNYEAYTYNSGSMEYAIGSYEVHTSNFAQGTGERMIRELRYMLNRIRSVEREAYCEHCKTNVIWEAYAEQKNLESGHYYLAGNYEGAQVKILDGQQVCFDLNGYTFTGLNRAFYTDNMVDNKVVFSVMDSSEGKTGLVQGCGGPNGAARGYAGGTILIGIGHEMNVYGGTFTFFERMGYSVYSGSVMLIRGTLNMYDGDVVGGVISSFTGTYYDSTEKKEVTANRTGIGAAMTVSGTLNMFGGTIENGKHQMITGSVLGDDEKGRSNVETIEVIPDAVSCVYVNVYKTTYKGQVNLYGDAVVDHIQFESKLDTNAFSVNGVYTGTAEVQFDSITSYADQDVLGVAGKDEYGVAADVSGASITVTGVEDLVAAVYGNNLVLSSSAATYKECEACGVVVQWMPMSDDAFDAYNGSKAENMEPGHYVLTEDVGTDQKQPNANGDLPGTFCIDLAGHTFTGKTRAFYVYNNAVLNIFDSVGGGVMEGLSGSAFGGGVLYAQGTGRINLYSGTVRHNDQNASKIKTAGIIRVNGGEFYMYGGTIEGMSVAERGGAVYVTYYSNTKTYGHVYFGGGTVTAGSADIAGNCVYVASGCSIEVAGDAQVDEIQFAKVGMFTVNTTNAPFTGAVQLAYDTVPVNGTALGSYQGNMGIRGDLTVNGSDLKVVVDGDKLILAGPSVDLYNKNGFAGAYISLEAAISAYRYNAQEGNYIKLSSDLVDDVAVDKDVYLDLNGFDIAGNITVAENAALYCMDNKTDDYAVADKDYGKLTGVLSGNITGVPVETVGAEESADDIHRAGYLKVTEETGVSFHRVNMNISSMYLRTNCVGLYYRSNFIGDELVAANVKSYGIAFSVKGEPTTSNINTTCMYSAFGTFTSGATGNVSANTGVILENVMKKTLSNQENEDRANIVVYGRSYILTEDGYIFGSTVKRTLKEQVVAIGEIYDQLNDTQRKGLLKMYGDYEGVMKSWEIDNVIDSYNATK